MQLTKNFNKIEFESRDGFEMSQTVLNNTIVLATNLQIVRNILNEPIHINSGYRSKGHNENVHGVKNSQHLLGNAADITMKNYTSKDLVIIFERLILTGDLKEGGLGLYNGFVHYDIRGARKRWNYSSKYKDFF
jgi:uncharacterized protein YcbK (DUF882 family)